MSNQFTHPEPSLPEWFKSAAPNALFSAVDTAKIFKYKTTDCLHQAVKRGNFPKADRFHEGINRHYTKPKLFWEKKTILQEFKRRLERHSSSKS